MSDSTDVLAALALGFGFEIPGPASAVRDAQGELVFSGAEIPARAILFVDLRPGANWAHDCAYVLIEPSWKFHVVRRRWPPAEKRLP